MNPKNSPIVVFDIGGVLVRICRTWEDACERIGLDAREGWNGEDAKRARSRLSHEYHLGSMTTTDFCAGIAAVVPGVYTPEEVRRVHDAWLIEEYAGVGTLIDDLHARGVETGVLSNTNEAHWDRLAGAAGRAAEFAAPGKVKHLHASHVLRLAKPEMACFRAFEKMAGATDDPSRLIFFDDLEENIAGANAAGWRGRQIDHRGDTAAQMRHILAHEGVL